MSFPPNLGITNSFIIDSTCAIFQEFPSLLPHLDQICSPFSKHKMNGYSRINKSAPNRSKSVDFGELSLSRSTPNTSNFIKETTPDIRSAVKITKMHDPIPEHENDEGAGEVLGAILSLYSVADRNAAAEQEITAVKRSFSIKRSASVSDGYSRIHHQSAEDGDQCGDELIDSHTKGMKKKGKLLRAFRRLFRL